MSALIQPPSQLDIDRALAQARSLNGFGLGGACSMSPARAVNRTDPRCYDVHYLMCCRVPIARAALDVAPGTAVTIDVEPQNSPYFKPCAFSVTVVDSADETLTREARMFGVFIQGCPQMGIRNANPTAASTDFIYASASFDPRNRDGCACPVGWGTFSNASNSFPLSLVFFNSNAVPINISVLVYGDEVQCAPACDPGHDRYEWPSVPTIG